MSISTNTATPINNLQSHSLESVPQSNNIRKLNGEEFKTPKPLKLKIKEKQDSKEEKVHQKVSQNHSVDRCDECKKAELVINHVEGTIVCQNCGLVQQSRIIDDSSEWRTFSSETSNGGANPSRVGGKLNPFLSNYGIDTQVKGGANAAEIQKWSDRSSLNAKDKLITKGLRSIKDYALHLNLKENTIGRASELYKQIEDNGMLKGKSVTAKVAAVIFVASRLMNQPKNIKQILAVTQAKQKELNSCYKKIKELIPEERVSLQAWQYADQACNKMGIPMDVNNAAKQVAKSITALEIATGRQPQTIAGVAIFVVSQLSTDKRSCQEISQAVQMTEQTIKQAYKEIYEYRDQIIPLWWKSKGTVDQLVKP